jgi:hypothetical protein
MREQLEDLDQRVRAIPGRPLLGIDLISDKMEHLSARERAAQERLYKRMKIVVREVSSGAYRKYSSGWWTALGDLLIPGRRASSA